jgi:succinoglycan biosynthesis transport protein ExoP
VDLSEAMDDYLPRSDTWKNQPPAIGPVGGEAHASHADIRSIFGILLRHWKLVVGVPLVFIAAAVLILSVIPAQYRSTVQILIVDPRQPTGSADDKRLSSLDVDAAAVSSQVEVMQSRSLALTVARDQGLDKDKEFTRRESIFDLFTKIDLLSKFHFFGWGDSATPSSETSEPAASIGLENVSPELDRAAEKLRRKESVERLQFSYVLSLSMTSEVPEKAQRLAMAIANTYLNDQLEARYEAARRSTAWLTTRLSELRARVSETEAAIGKLKAENGLSDTGASGNVSQQQTSDINGQLVLARADAAEKRARYDQIRRAAASNEGLQSIPEVMASTVIGQLRVQQAELSRRATELRSRFGERYPEYINSTSQLSDINRAISAEVNRILGNMKNAYEIAVQRVQSLEGSLSAITGQTGNSQALVRLRELERQADSNRKLYEHFLNQFNEIDQRSTLVDSGARIISPAPMPVDPSYPRHVLVLFLTTIAGLVLGAMVAFLVEYLDSGFKTALRVEEVLGYPVLGMVPAIRLSRIRWLVDQEKILMRMVSQPFSQISEAIRSIRMGITISDVDDPPRVLLITSSVPAEGKSTIAMLLAASAAHSQQRAVLVDCDLRRKNTSRTFKLRDKPGLTEVLTGKISVEEATYRFDAANIAVIPGGMDVGNPADLLNSERMQEFVARLRMQYDLVVLDASPLLPVIDAAVLARLADKILMILEWSRTPRTSAVDALKLLAPESRRIAGVVLNKVDYRRLRSYGYGYGYGYNYGHYYRTLDKYYGKP